MIWSHARQSSYGRRALEAAIEDDVDGLEDGSYLGCGGVLHSRSII